jgi:hypothetical protein
MWYVFQHEELYPELSARIDKLVVGISRQNVQVGGGHQSLAWFVLDFFLGKFLA